MTTTLRKAYSLITLSAAPNAIGSWDVWMTESGVARVVYTGHSHPVSIVERFNRELDQLLADGWVVVD